jgi:signal transduction histidine kinase
MQDEPASPRLPERPEIAEPSFLSGGGEMGARMRAKDWSRTALGPAAQWPQSLKTAVRIMLTSRQPMFVWWGEELLNLYNDAYKSIVGGKHPEALGQPASQVWREIWDQVGPRAESVVRRNEGTYDEALLLIMERHGYPEETYYTFSYSPVPDDFGGTGGILCANTEDTRRILGERQVELLRELAASTADARTFEEACVRSATCLATNPRDLPFSLIYLVDPERHRLVLAGTAGIERGHVAAPSTVLLDTAEPWPFAEVLRTQKAVLVTDLAAKLDLPVGAWGRPPHQAVTIPIAASGQTGKAGILVAGLNPFRLFDDSYRGFVDLVAAQIAASVANAQAYEEERKRAESLAEIDRAKTAFFSNVSHEFRTPLTLMLGPLDDILAEPAEPAEPGNQLPPAVRDLLTVVHRNGQRLLKLVNTLLDFSRIEAGRVEAVFQPVDLATCTAELASVFRSAIEKAGMRLLLDTPPLPEPVFVDRDMWEKIVLNLVSNAFKYTLEGEIRVALRAENGAAVLEVADTGTGIPEAELPRIFDRFHRVEGARGRTHEGTGIGLALVQELARLHGGSVEATSVHGEGSTFRVAIPLGDRHLPAQRIRGTAPLASTSLGARPFVEEAMLLAGAGAPRLEPEVEPEMPPHARHAARILLADDNADMGDYVRRLLADRYEVELVADGEAALAAARERPPDLVLTDVMMPLLDGFGLLRELRADPRTSTIPVILLSARAGEESRVSGLERGADYLIKPFSAKELLARVGAQLEMARVRKEAAAELERHLASATEARLQAEAANRLKDEFLATVSHELRTPLNAVLGWVQLLQVSPFDETATRRALATIERNARAQNQLIEDLLDVSRIITGKLRLDVRQVDLLSVIQAAIDVVRPTAENKGVRIQAVLDPLAGPVSGDPGRLQQVAWNVLANAIKFTPRGGRVQIRLERVNSHVEIVVSDTGVGIDPDFKPYVFERFRQADASSSRPYGGLGLGLAIVRHLVDLHGGTVRAESEGIGQGATFVIGLPLTVAHSISTGAGRAGTGAGGEDRVHPAAGAALPFTPSPVLSGLRVLVVDDEPDARALVTAILEHCEASVVTASSVAEALGVLDRETIDVVVSDIEMPGEDGYSFIRKLRARAAEGKSWIPAAALTAYSRAEDRHRAMVEGYQIHIPKPVEPAELVAVVSSLAGRLHDRPGGAR